MLGNEGKYVLSVSHEALIDDELYNNVQKVLKQKKVSAYYTQKLELPLRGLVRCGECRRVYTPYMQKGTQYFGARCTATCSNTKKSFNIAFLEEEVGKFLDRLIFTKDEKIQLDSTTSTDISLFEEKRLKKIEQSDRRKKKIREDLTYLRTNKLSLLKSGVYTPEVLLQEETTLNTELNTIQDEEIISDLSMQAVMEDILKLSELLETGSAYYSNAKSPEKERVIKTIFSELFISENTLQYKCRNGFRALETKNFLVCDPFTGLTPGKPKGNETSCVAFLTQDAPVTLGQKMKQNRLKLRKTRKQMASELGISVKTLWGWETDRWLPTAAYSKIGWQIPI